MKGNSESKKLYEKYKGRRVSEGGTIIGWSNEPCLMVSELDKPTGWGYMAAADGVYSEKDLKEGDYYWYVLKTDVI